MIFGDGGWYCLIFEWKLVILCDIGWYSVISTWYPSDIRRYSCDIHVILGNIQVILGDIRWYLVIFGDIEIYLSAICWYPCDIGIGDGRERLVTASPVMTKSRAPAGGNNYPARVTAETWHTGPQPSRHVRRKSAAPLSGTEEQTARAINAHAQCACLLSLQMRSIN